MAPKSTNITKESGTVILILGPTGAGKSTFINAAAGQAIANVNHALASSDSEVQGFTVSHPKKGRSFVFVDTPGFDHYSLSDGLILKRIVDWVKKRCQLDADFGGIIYLHDITASRVPRSGDIPTVALVSLTRPEPAKHVLITTAKWGRIKADDPVGDREEELRDKTWKRILDGGARLGRFTDTQESAWELVDSLVDERPLQINVLRKDLDRIQHLCSSETTLLIRFKKGLFAFLFKIKGRRIQDQTS